MDIPTLALPGPFVVLQGMEGDGLSNTIDTMPYAHLHHRGHHSEDGDSSYSTTATPPPPPFRGSAARQQQQQQQQHHTTPRRNRTAYDEHSDDRNRGGQDGSQVRGSPPRSPVSEMDYDQEEEGGGEVGLVEEVEEAEEEDDDELGGFHHVSRQDEAQHPTTQQQQRGRGGVTVSSSSENSSSRESIVILQHGDGIAEEDDGQGGRPAPSPGSPPRARRRTQDGGGGDGSSPDGDGEGGVGDGQGQQDSSSPSAAPSPREVRDREREDASIRGWRRECREREVAQLTEVWQQWRGAGGPPRGRGRGDPASSCWWQRDGRLAVFASPTVHPTPAAGGVEEDEDDVEDVLLLGTLAPGSVVRGCELVPALPTFRSARQLVPPEGEGVANDRYTFLRIEAPLSGFVLYRRDHYNHLAPGMPTGYCDPSTWVWRVTCPDGAYVRTGLELNSSHLCTIPYGVLMKVTRKTVNAMGLSRLRISYAKSTQGDGPEGMRLRRTDSVGCDSTTVPQSNTASGRDHRDDGGGNAGSPILMEGWISEALNPLSGQRGPIAQPLPFPIPALYRVTLPDGAVVRSDIELSSSEVRVAPFGSVIKVVGRAFSEHPMDQCIERLRLAGGGGWVSVRLNRPPPLDVLIVELIGLDESFDPDDPGRYHIRAQEDHEEYLRPASSIGGSSVAEEGGPESSPSSSHAPPPGIGSVPSLGRGPSAVVSRSVSSRGYGRSAPSRRGIPGGDGAGGYHSGMRGRSGRGLERGKSKAGSSRRKHFNKGEVNEEKCLICLTEERTATIVHGETGHIACCLTCARILRARGDKCPVCRLPIDLVIQHFWC